MARKSFAGAAPTTQLTSGISGSDASFSVTNGTGYPTGPNPFVVTIDRGLTSEEKLLCSTRSGNNFTVAGGGRGYDGTSATAHANQASVNHVLDANTVDEANDHVNTPARDDHTQYLTSGRHDVTARHTFGAGLGTPAAATASAVGDSSAAGAAANPARADHLHGRESFATPSPLVAGGGNTAGGAVTTVRGDHVHGAPVAAPGNSTPGNTTLTGSSPSFSAADHQHAREAWGNSGDITTSNPSDALAVGSSGRLADAAHKHAREQVTATGSTIIGGNVPAGKIPYPQTGTVTVSTSGAGGFNITLPKAFGSGLISVFIAPANTITANQDWNVTPVKANHSLSVINGLAQHTQDSSAIISGSIDVSFIAWGWD